MNKYKNHSPIHSLNQIQNKLNISNNNLHKKLYEYENNEITKAVKKLPQQKYDKEYNKTTKRRRPLFFTKELRELIELNPNSDTLLKHFKKYNKEKNYRCLLFKGNVYDSLNDEEESEEEIDDNYCYFEPDSLFLYMLDGIILFCSLIILLYFPYYLSKNLYYCQNIFEISTIIFYIIDFMYIFDLIINFYRSYYNYDEYLVKSNIYICINYFKTWFLLDFICSIPTFTILKSLENKCIGKGIYKDNQINNNGYHSHYYNTNPYNIHYLFSLIKVIKTIKILKKNITLLKIGKILCGSEFLTDWGNVILYSFFLLSFLNLSACIYIFIGRNSLNNWIYFNSLELQNYYNIYIGSVYYVIETVTTVGYGDLIGRNLKEIIFQVIMIIVGTCIYSWLISSISNYIQKMSEKNTQYDKKLEILEEIKLNNPHLKHKLYDKILRLLHYRKYHEDETEKNIVLNSLPNSLKNCLIIEMYKKFINNFMFFKGIDNKEFIVQIISKLNPIIGIKGDTLIKEGEYIDDIIFIKDGILSLEISIDINYPEKSIEEYLTKYGYISPQELELYNNSNNNCNKYNYKKSYKHASNSFGQFYYELIKRKTRKFINDNINENDIAFYNSQQNFEIEKNLKTIKILDIRKNEHFGDVLMFLNKKSPLYIRVRSNKADLLLLKKLDALKISTNYPNIWKKIIKKPLANSKIIQNLIVKMLVDLCNYYGIKTKLFKKRKNKMYPSYYLKPVINKIKKDLDSPKSPKKRILTNNNEEEYDEEKSDNIGEIIRKKSNKISELNIIDNLNKSENLNKSCEFSNNNNIIKSSLSYNFKNKYKDLLNNINAINGIQPFNTIKNKYFNYLDFEINEKKNSQNLSSNESENNNKNLKNNTSNNISSSFSFKNPSMSKNNNFPSQNNLKKLDIDNSLSLNKEYKPTLFKKKNSKISSENNPQKYYYSTKMFSQNELENLDFKYDDINDELYPGEDSFIKEYKNEKPNKEIITKNNESQKIISDNVYINNYNIIKSPYFATYYNNNYNIHNYDKNEIKKFISLKISSSISTINIKSSYENINNITKNSYILNEKLQLKTKNFLIEECKANDEKINKILNNKTQYKYQNSLGKCINSDIIDKASFFKNYTHKINSYSSIKNDFEKIKQSYIRNKSIHKLNKDELFNNLNKKKTASSISLSIKNKLYNIDHIHDKYTKRSIINKKHLDLEKNNIIPEEKQEENSKISNNIEHENQHENINNQSKKKKKQKEMDIISLNIKRSSQNLYQPDIFYADLFSHLIFRKKSSKYHSSSKILKSSNIIENNELEELKEEKSQTFFSDEYSKE